MAPLYKTASSMMLSTEESATSASLKELWRVGDLINGVAFAILILFTAFGNLLIIAAVVKSKNLRFRTHFYIASLSLANLLMAGVVMPLRVMSFLDKSAWFENPRLCETYGSFFVLFCTVTVYTLAAMSLDRYFSIARYKWYQKFLTNCRTFGFIVLCWSTAVLVSFLFANLDNDFPKSLDCRLSKTYTTVYVYVFVSIEVLTPTFFMLILQWKVMKTAVSHLHTIDVHGRQMKNLDYADFPSVAKESTWSKIVVRITLSFVIFWIPRCIFLLLDNSNTEGIHEVADGLTEIMTYCFPASFALLLGYWSKEFKEEFTDMLCPYSCYQKNKDMKKYRLREANKVNPSMMYRKHSKNFAVHSN